MAGAPLSSSGGLADPLLCDAQIAGLFTIDALTVTMLRVEGALAGAQAELKLIPADAAAAIGEACDRLSADPPDLSASLIADGTPVPALVTVLRAEGGEAAAPFVHFGATSQDIVDTAMVLRLGEALDILKTRLVRVGDALAGLAEIHRDTVMASRTRAQQAGVTTFGLKCAVWLAPLLRHRSRLAGVRAHALMLSFAGAGGTMLGYGPEALALETAVADRLHLSVAPAPWHGARDALFEAGALAAGLATSLGKIGQDVIVMSQSEIAELNAPGGGSSALPHKANPVQAERLVALAAESSGRISTLAWCGAGQNERDGGRWMLEWRTLSALMEAAGASLAITEGLLGDLRVDDEAMKRSLTNGLDLVLAEAAVIALGAVMDKEKARTEVATAAELARASRHSLVEILSARAAGGIDWTVFADPRRHTGTAGALVDRTLAQWRQSR